MNLRLFVRERLPAPMGKGELQRLEHVGQLDNRPAPEGTDSASRAGDDQVGPVTGNRTIEAEPGDEGPDRFGERDPREAAARRLQQVAQPGLPFGRGVVNGAGALQKIALELHDAQPLVDIGKCHDVDAQPEAVQQLRPQLPLFGVHGADQDEMGGMYDGHPLALDDVDAHRRGIEQHVDQMVVEQVDLVDI